jgi:hypothetical protein
MATTPDPASASSPEDEEDVASEPNRSSPGAHSPEEIFASLRSRVEEFADYAVYYLLSKIDAIKFAIEWRIMVGSFVAIGVLAAAGAIVTAVVLVCEGICDGLSELLGHRWAGELVTGAVLLGGVAVIGWIAVAKFAGRPHLSSVKRFEFLRRRQKDRRGRDVTDRNAEEVFRGPG